MKNERVWGLMGLVLLLAGCATKPPAPTALRQETLVPANGRVVVAMTKIQPADTYLPGAGCLLCIAAASAMNSSLTTHTKTLSLEDTPKLKDEVTKRLRAKGMDVVMLSEPIDLDTFAAISSEDEKAARRDFTSLGKKHNAERVLVIQVDQVGFERSYSSYVPTSDPKAVLRGLGYMVNLKTQTYEWYQPVSVLRASAGAWDEPPKYPGLTNAYYQALEVGRDQFLSQFPR